jgi:hypothetical protein
MGLLHQSKANIYKKLQGKLPFSMEEYLTIARKYNISLDTIVHRLQGEFQKISFDYSFPENKPRTPETFLEKIHFDLQKIAQIPQASIAYASNEIPLFHSLRYPLLTAFKLFVWARTNWQMADHKNTGFDPDIFSGTWPAVEKYRKAIVDLYDQIPGKEFWSRTVADNILNQIRYYEKGGFFTHKTTPDLLREELAQLLEHCMQMAANHFKSPGGNRENAASLDLYLNEIAYTNNIILIYRGEWPQAVYATMDNPNFLRSQDPVFCRRMHDWIKQIEASSFNTGNELHRINLFRHLQQKVGAGD